MAPQLVAMEYITGVVSIHTREPDEHDFNSPKPDAKTTVQLLTFVTILGWVAFGLVTILSINRWGKRGGRWVPEWYRKSEGTNKDKARLGAWWTAIMFIWPFATVFLASRQFIRSVTKKVKKLRDSGAGHNGGGPRGRERVDEVAERR